MSLYGRNLGLTLQFLEFFVYMYTLLSTVKKEQGGKGGLLSYPVLPKRIRRQDLVDRRRLFTLLVVLVLRKSRDTRVYEQEGTISKGFKQLRIEVSMSGIETPNFGNPPTTLHPPSAFSVSDSCVTRSWVGLFIQFRSLKDSHRTLTVPVQVSSLS